MPIRNARVIVEGHAIVSADGMIADARGEMPAGLRNEADWRLFQAALDRAALVVLGRLGHERHANPGRRRLVMTRSVRDLASDPRDPHAMFWNPAGMPIETALGRLGIGSGVLAITGGTAAFDLFLPHYDSFFLSEARGLQMPGGRPCFSQHHPQIALRAAGLTRGEPVAIDRGAGIFQTTWRRP